MGTVRRLPPGTLSVTVLFPDLLLHPPSQARCSLASSPKGRAKGRALPARLFPRGGNNVGAKRRQCKFQHLQMKFGGTMSKYGTFATLLHYWAKSVLLKNLPRWRAADSRPYTVCATESPSGNSVAPSA